MVKDYSQLNKEELLKIVEKVVSTPSAEQYEDNWKFKRI